jgi:hypothetical protein
LRFRSRRACYRPAPIRAPIGRRAPLDLPPAGHLVVRGAADPHLVAAGREFKALKWPAAGTT